MKVFPFFVLDEFSVSQRRAAAIRRVVRFRSVPSSWLIACLALALGLTSASGLDVRWSLSSNRIYVTGPGTVTLSDILAAQNQAPLKQVSPGVWLLRANLVIENGAQLNLHGAAAGGDVDRLRLQSNNDPADTNRFVSIIADWGLISIQNTAITSWDDAVDGPDTEYATNGRAFIAIRSELAADGVTPLESRMDIISSEIGYLGYDESEAYGLSWKVIGDQPGLLDRVNVFGDVVNSRIHHNFFGLYTFGAYAMHCLGSEIDNNIQYGFDAHDDSDYLLIQDSDAHHNGNHGIIASKRCDHLTIRSNRAWANAQNGIILHRSSDDCLVEGNQCFDNGDSGIVLTADSRCVVRSNLLVRNFEAAIRLDLGAADNLITANVCASNAWYGFYLYKGSDEPEPNDDGRPKRNRFVNNQVYANKKEAINLFDSDDNVFSMNVFYDNDDDLHFERGFRNVLDANSIPTNVTVNTVGSPADTPSTYVSNQAAIRVQVDQYSSTIFADGDGQIFDPEEKGVATTVTTNGSTLILTAAEIGTTTTVAERNLWVSAPGGSVSVEPTSWVSGPAEKQWAARADPPGITVNYTVGELDTNQTYSVTKNGDPLTTLKPDAAGMVHFTDTISTTNKVLYSVASGARLSVEQVSDRLAVSWSGGILQRATTLSPPNWQDVPTTNGQFRIKIKPTEPMELFRILLVPPLDPGAAPGANFDLSHWKLTLPDAVASTISAAQLTAGYTNYPFFYTGADGAAVFSCPVTGGSTGGSDYPRSELREVIDPQNDNVTWSGYGTHILSARCKVTQLPSTQRTVIGQIHSFTGNAFPLVKLVFDNGAVEALTKDSPNSATNETFFSFGNVGLSNVVAYEIKLADGLLSMTVNGVHQSVNVFQTDPAWTNQTFYFKAGNYCQDNAGPPDEGAVVSFYQLTVTHDPPFTSPQPGANAAAGFGGQFPLITLPNPAGGDSVMDPLDKLTHRAPLVIHSDSQPNYDQTINSGRPDQ